MPRCTAGDLGVDLDDDLSEPVPPSRPGEWLEYSMTLPILAEFFSDIGGGGAIAEAPPSLVNPFFMLPLLAVLKLRARDLVGFTFLQLVLHLPVVLLLVWLLGMTFDLVPR